MTLNTFDTIAPFYDKLTMLVFGKTIQQAQKYFLDEVHPKEKVLILGGGSGWILAELFNARQDYEVWYIEASQKMIALAKEKCKSYPCVHFIHGTEDDIPSDCFDVVITNFYLDLFKDDSLTAVIQKISKSLKVGSRWVVTDFVNGGKWWQSLMLKVMYIFFRLTCKIETERLPDWQSRLHENDFRADKFKFFYGGFIKSAVYQTIS